MGFDRWLKSTMTFEDDRSFSKSFVNVGKIMGIQRIDDIFAILFGENINFRQFW